MIIQSQTIYGETIEDLLPALVAFADAMHIDADGMVHSSVTLAPKQALPFQKALMRAEAALMLEDADGIGSLSYEDRSYEQRAHDAFMRLVKAVGQDPANPRPAHPVEPEPARRDSNPQPSDP